MLEPVPDTQTTGRFDFRDVRRRESSPGTHKYHQYPMRFIPQLARSLIETYSREGDTVADPFMGSGTVLVQARILRRESWGIDINPVAVLIARAETQAIEPTVLHEVCQEFSRRLALPLPPPSVPMEQLERLLWWFPEENVKRLGVLRRLVFELPGDVQAFFLCAFSSILKRCSFWSPDSIKQIRSEKRRRRKIMDPFSAMRTQLAGMELGNEEFWRLTRGSWVRSRAQLGDARRLPADDETVDLIVTSPPYVTAYDYTEVFELPLLWLGEDRNRLRSQIIGTHLVGRKAALSHMREDAPWRNFVEEVHKRDPRSGAAAAQYYCDMDLFLQEAIRILSPGGHIALVAGDNVLRGVHMPNSGLFAEVLESEGLRLVFRGERLITGRSLPPFRDARTGRFLKAPREGSLVAHPTETVMVYQKPGRKGRSGSGREL